MPEQPKILQVVSEMRAEGFSDDQIINNLRQLGLSDDQIKQIMKIADKDVYSKFKRDMGDFIDQRIEKDRPIIEKISQEEVKKSVELVKKELMVDSEKTIGEFAKTINEKSSDLSLALKKVREENLAMKEEAKLTRADIDLLLSGPSKMRLVLSLFFLFLGLLVLFYTVFFALPRIIALDFASDMMNGVILATTALALLATTLGCWTVGVYFSGKPGRQ